MSMRECVGGVLNMCVSTAGVSLACTLVSEVINKADLDDIADPEACALLSREELKGGG